ncbi:response regulator transcription factor [Anaerocolumna chitinilytica]|uniref:Stage 0 sporulation protein A homolog n=1 Tax=Anaerocolumna chitinilytica TaxID=1727145 RepID=A0A7I8DV99_9FIRM|nr:response regulator transcription factor [Anaerocolumna chitinilytica]BCK01046.1 DNA-binding response regulator [Anaerocolumna chitinilytica]
MSRILAIDDDIQILSIIKKALENEQHSVDILDRAEKVKKDYLTKYDLILLDVMMPEKDGFTICKEIRDSVDCPIIFLTAKTMDTDLIEGFAAGADDYIKKPFSLSEIRARVNAHLRREKREYHTRIISDNFKFDVSEKILYLNDEQIKLTKSEYEICEFLTRNKGQVFSLEQIIEKVFGFDFESDVSAVREHVKNIRAKLKQGGENPIETVWGIGYKWN